MLFYHLFFFSETKPHKYVIFLMYICTGQEVNCEQRSSQSCGDFRPKIWNEAFSNKDTMEFTEYVFKTAEKLATNEVCSDTYRSLFKFVEMLATSENAHYTMLMIDKMMLSIMMENAKDAGNFNQLLIVLERIFTDKKVTEFVSFYFKEWFNLLSKTENRAKLFRLVKAFETLTRPSKAEVDVKETFNRIKNLIPFRKNK